jgi:hypothetical protein
MCSRHGETDLRPRVEGAIVTVSQTGKTIDMMRFPFRHEGVIASDKKDHRLFRVVFKKNLQLFSSPKSCPNTLPRGIVTIQTQDYSTIF